MPEDKKRRESERPSDESREFDNIIDQERLREVRDERERREKPRYKVMDPLDEP